MYIDGLPVGLDGLPIRVDALHTDGLPVGVDVFTIGAPCFASACAGQAATETWLKADGHNGDQKLLTSQQLVELVNSDPCCQLDYLPKMSSKVIHPS